jgi:hypothetical protein
LDLRGLPTAAGFADIRESSIEVHILVADPQTCWRFHMSHGFAGFVHALSPADAAELQELAMAALYRMQAEGGIILGRGATVTLATKNGRNLPPPSEV